MGRGALGVRSDATGSLTAARSDALLALREIGVTGPSLTHAFFKDRRIRLSGASPENTFRGSLHAQIEASAVAASLGLRYRF